MNQITGTIISLIIIVGFILMMVLSFGGEPDYTNQQDIYDGSSRATYP